MLLLVLEELDLAGALLVFLFLAFGVATLNGRQFRSQLNYFVCLFCFLGLQLSDSLLEIGLSVLRLELLSHRERYRAMKAVMTLNEPYLWYRVW
jgi:hypothetical protein